MLSSFLTLRYQIYADFMRFSKGTHYMSGDTMQVATVAPPVPVPAAVVRGNGASILACVQV